MLSLSSKLVHRSHRVLHLSKCFNHLERRTDVNVKEKLMQISSTAVTKYNEIIGFDEIEKAYRKVTLLQEELAKTQTERTTIQLQINHIRQQLTNLQSQIQDTRRGEARYIELMKRGEFSFRINHNERHYFHVFLEFEIMQEKNSLEEKFDIIDNQERELFANLQSKINILHEKNRTHTRQWGIISTIIGALLGVIGTSISAYYRNNDIRRVQHDFQIQSQEAISQIKKDNQKIMETYADLRNYLQKLEFPVVKQKEILTEVKQDQKRESWASYLGRKTVGVWRWCTFQKSS